MLRDRKKLKRAARVMLLSVVTSLLFTACTMTVAAYNVQHHLQ